MAAKPPIRLTHEDWAQISKWIDGLCVSWTVVDCEHKMEIAKKIGRGGKLAAMRGVQRAERKP